MADGEENAIVDKDSLLQTQKREKRELQARIQDLKNSVPKGDKKRKKEAAAEIARLEQELEKKHSEERNRLEHNQIGVTDDAHAVELSNGFHLSLDDAPHKPEGKVSKAQKRRDKKAQAASERDARIAEQEVKNLQGERHLEEVSIKALLRDRGLALHQIPADGNCLYQAVVHQLGLNGKNQPESCTVAKLRSATAAQMRENADGYLPFLSNPQTGDALTSEEFEAYCMDLEKTNAWGGQIEIRALSEALKTPIEVVQATGPSIILGEDYLANEKTLVLSYHRHAFGLGEHYNSVVIKSKDDGVEESEDNF